MAILVPNDSTNVISIRYAGNIGEAKASGESLGIMLYRFVKSAHLKM